MTKNLDNLKRKRGLLLVRITVQTSMKMQMRHDGRRLVKKAKLRKHATYRGKLRYRLEYRQEVASPVQKYLLQVFGHGRLFQTI